jgi:hypothetical protein
MMVSKSGLRRGSFYHTNKTTMPVAKCIEMAQKFLEIAHAGTPSLDFIAPAKGIQGHSSQRNPVGIPSRAGGRQQIGQDGCGDPMNVASVNKSPALRAMAGGRDGPV